jgi:hypothetical protein
MTFVNPHDDLLSRAVWVIRGLSDSPKSTLWQASCNDSNLPYSRYLSIVLMNAKLTSSTFSLFVPVAVTEKQKREGAVGQRTSSAGTSPSSQPHSRGPRGDTPTVLCVLDPGGP